MPVMIENGPFCNVPRWQALAEPAKNEPCETACRMAGTEIYDFEGEE